MKLVPAAATAVAIALLSAPASAKTLGVLLGRQPRGAQPADRHHHDRHERRPSDVQQPGGIRARARRRSCRRSPKSWSVSDDGTVYTFKLRAGVKFHSNRTFTPTRDMNADDVAFSLMRQWKEDHPYHRISGASFDYFKDMGMPDLLKSIEKVDDRTIRIDAHPAGGAVPRQHGDAVQRHPLGRIRRSADARRHARAARPGADRHRTVHVRRLPEGHCGALSRVSGLLGRPHADRHAGVLDHAQSARAPDQAQRRRMPGHGVSQSRRHRRDREPTRRSSCCGRKGSTSAIWR